MSRELHRYCRWKDLSGVTRVLSSSDVDITEDYSSCIELAISNRSTEIFRALLYYYSKKNPTPSVQDRSKICEDLSEYITMRDLTPEMMDVVIENMPWLADKSFTDALENGDLETIRYLYPRLQKYEEAYLNTAATGDLETLTSLPPKIGHKKFLIQEVVNSDNPDSMECIAEFESKGNARAIIYRIFADSLAKKGMYEVAEDFYKKSMSEDPEYNISYIHLANSILERQSVSRGFDIEMLKKAECYYKDALKASPRYSSAYKKLGILYEQMKEVSDDIEEKDQYDILAFKAYVSAIETRREGIKYESVYKEISKIYSRHSGTEAIEEIVSGALDEKLVKIFSGESSDVSASSIRVRDDESSASTETLEESLQEMLWEDSEEEGFLDSSDLMGEAQ